MWMLVKSTAKRMIETTSAGFLPQGMSHDQVHLGDIGASLFPRNERSQVQPILMDIADKT